MRYLLITFLRKANGQIDEQVSVSKRIKPADIQTCNVILDFVDKKIEKCVIEGKTLDTNWDKMYEYYKKIYPTLIGQLDKETKVEQKQNGA